MPDPVHLGRDGEVTLYCGDMLDVLQTLPAESVQCCVTSPPYWWLRSGMPWVKRSAMPESATDRPTSALEYMFLLTKSAQYYFDMEAVRKKAASATIERDKYSRILDDDGPQALRHDHETQVDPAGRQWRNADLFFESIEPPHEMIFAGDEPAGLDVISKGFPGAHFAVYPEYLVEPCIKAGTSERGCCPECGAPWRRVVEKNITLKSGSGRSGHELKGKHEGSEQATSGTYDIRMGPVVTTQTLGWKSGCKCRSPQNVGCVVLDPFLGSGASIAVAVKLGRRGIGIELNPKYMEMAKQRISQPIENEGLIRLAEAKA